MLRPLPTPVSFCFKASCRPAPVHQPRIKTASTQLLLAPHALSTNTESLDTDRPSKPTTVTRRTSLTCLLAATAAALQPALPCPPALAKRDAGDWSAPGLNAPEDDAAPKFFKTISGVKIQELSQGSGPTAQQGDTVLFDYVLRRSNGYFIYGTIEGVSFQPKDIPVGPVSYKLGDGQIISGLEDVLYGMQPGGRRRALIPPEVGYLDASMEPQPPTFATKRQLENHRKEPLLFEVQLLRVGGKK